MKTIRNLTRLPIKVTLPGGKTLYLGPTKTGQVSDAAAELASFKRHVDEGRVEIVGDEHGAATGAASGGAVHERTHGHPPTKVNTPKGDR